MVMTKRGISEMWMIIIAGIMAFVILIWAIGFMSPMIGAGKSAVSSVQMRVNFLKCPPADDPKQDIDMDGCVDTQDFCVVDMVYLKSIGYNDKDPNVLTEEDLCALGNQYCDNDKDFVPDICDPNPQNANILCEIEAEGWLGIRNKCKRIPKDEMDKLNTFALLPTHEATVKKQLLTA